MCCSVTGVHIKNFMLYAELLHAVNVYDYY